MKKPLRILIKSNGDMLDYATSYGTNNPNYSYIDAVDFTDRLEFSHMWGYRAGRVSFTSLNSGRIYYMFLSDFEAAIKARKFVDNILDGEFKFVKKGTAQSVKLILQKAP